VSNAHKDAGASTTSELKDPELLTAKGRKTRKRILEGARRAFEKRGNYIETRLTDIAQEAGVAYGSLYTYFDSKESLFREMVDQIEADAYDAVRSSYRGDDPLKRIESANLNFHRRYKENVQIQTVIEQSASIYPEFREFRRRLRQPFVDRIQSNISRLQVQGLARRDIDARTAAHALVSMIDNFHYVWLVLGEPFDEETAIRTINDIWIASIGLTLDGNESEGS
jgi:AcrR family transcriptional regulator